MQFYYKDKILNDNMDYFIIPKFVSMLPFDEALILGYLIDSEKITKHIIVNDKEFFQCSMEGFMRKIFVNVSTKQIKLVLTKLCDKGLIDKLTLNENGKNSTYIKLNYEKLDELYVNFMDRKSD